MMPTVSETLVTKIQPPRRPPGYVERPRISSILGESLAITLLEAPGGYGKTTAMSGYADQFHGNVSWVTLDRLDDGPAILRQLAQSIEKTLGDGESDDWGGGDPELRVITAINRIHACGQAHLQVIDNFHYIEGRELESAFVRLFEHLPSCMQLLLASRHRPPPGLARYALEGRLQCLRAEQLRYLPQEALALWRGHPSAPTEERILAHHQKCQGWPLGVRLFEPARDLGPGRPTDTETLAAYLHDELLADLEPELRGFILRICQVDCFDAELAEALIGEDGPRLIRTLVHRQFPLQVVGTFYRFPSFVLGALRGLSGDRLARSALMALHGQASQAWAGRGEFRWALNHALAAGEFELAEGLLLQLAQDLFPRGEERAVLRAIEAFPEHLQQGRARLLIYRAWAECNLGVDRLDVETTVLQARQVMAGQAQADDLAMFELICATTAQLRGDLEAWASCLAAVDGHAAALPPSMRATLELQQAQLHVVQNRSSAAKQRLQDLERQSADPFVRSMYRWVDATIDCDRGQARKGAQVLEELTRRLDAAGQGAAGHMYVGKVCLAQAYFMLGRLAEAEQACERALEGIDLHADPEHGYYLLSLLAMIQARLVPETEWGVVLARVRQLPQRCACPGLDARLRVLELKLMLAEPIRYAEEIRQQERRWLHGNQEDAGRYLPIARWPSPINHPLFVATVEAELVLFSGQFQRARSLLERVHQDARNAGRGLEFLESALLLARVERNCGEEAAHERWLHLAIDTLVRDECIAACFGQSSEELEVIARELQVQGREDLAGRIQALLKVRGQGQRPTGDEREAATGPRPSSERPRLSQRETEVLSMVAQGLSNAEAGRALFVAPSTVKKHLENIYAKLDVGRRMQAVRKARVLGLLVDPKMSG